MADTGVPGNQLPPPPQPNAGAPGYENGNGSNAHMPPPPLHIPPNTNPIPTAVTSPMSGDQIMSPSSGGAFPRRAAPEPNKRALYVGGLDPRVTEDVLRQIFETTGHVQNVKIIPDKNVCDNPSPTELGWFALSDPPTLRHPLTSLARIRDSTMALLNTMTLAQPSARCKLSTVVAYTNWYALVDPYT